MQISIPEPDGDHKLAYIIWIKNTIIIIIISLRKVSILFNDQLLTAIWFTGIK